MTDRLTRQKRWREAHPERYRAHLALGRAKRQGILSPAACTHCGKENAEAHHTDYDQPLLVMWLCRRCHCRRCHCRLHAKERRA